MALSYAPRTEPTGTNEKAEVGNYWLYLAGSGGFVQQAAISTQWGA